MFHSPEVRPALAVVRVCLEFLIKVLPVTPAPLDSGKVKGCDGFYQASTSQNCQGLLKVYSIISEKKHLGCNPGLKGDCNAFKSGYWYCVADFASMSLTIVLLLYFQPGTISGCQRVYFVKDVDSCWSIANSNGIDLSDFYKWNSGVAADCKSLWLKNYVCIGVSGLVTTLQ